MGCGIKTGEEKHEKKSVENIREQEEGRVVVVYWWQRGDDGIWTNGKRMRESLFT